MLGTLHSLWSAGTGEWTSLANLADFREGSKADLSAPKSDLLSSLDSGNHPPDRPCPLCAATGLMHRSKCPSFDHLVGAGQ
jgi:hypothetical protein